MTRAVAVAAPDRLAGGGGGGERGRGSPAAGKGSLLRSPRDQAKRLSVCVVGLSCCSETLNAYLTYLMYFISCFLTVTRL